MPTPPNARSIKIADDERGGWSSDRPRRGGGPERPADMSVRCRVLTPSDTLRYSPGSLLVIVSASPVERDRFLTRLIEEKSALLSLGKVRELLAGRVPEEQVDERAAELLDAAVAKRFDAGATVVLAAEGLTAEERDRYVRMAAAQKRPRHLILLETARDQVPEEDRGVLNDLRRRLDAGQLGAEGFQTAMRLGGQSIGEVKRLVFRAAPRDE
jgi:predicted kinase